MKNRKLPVSEPGNALDRSLLSVFEAAWTRLFFLNAGYDLNVLP
jgi:hypothetical protein